MDCLKGYIGIAGCGAVLPVPGNGQTLSDVYSGLTINQLPGISLKSIEKIANAEQENFLGVWKDVERRALLKFSIAFKGRLNLNHSLTNKTVVNCLACENKELFAVSLWYLLGTEMMIERTSSDRLNRYTTGIDLEKAEELKISFYSEYQTAFEDAMNAIAIAGSDCLEPDQCLECNNQYISFVEASV